MRERKDRLQAVDEATFCPAVIVHNMFVQGVHPNNCRAGIERACHSIEGVSQVRVKLNALSQAFSRRSEEQKDSTQAHLLSLGTFALENALVQGLPFSKAASRLASSCNEDELVSAALQALPKYSDDRVRSGAQGCSHR
jgi:cation transport ATPase